MKTSLLIVCTLFTAILMQAQFIKKTSIEASIGIGHTIPNDDADISGSGFFLQGEYVMTLASWIQLRPYTGIIFTSPDTLENAEVLPDYKTTTKAFSLGGKSRIIAPIPWVAPYIELGIGASAGSFRTFTPYVNIDKSGVVIDFPWAVGLAIGRHHQFNISVNYLDHFRAEQTSGAVAFGYSFPLDTQK